MNTRFLESFILVVQLGSFRAAAEKLHITQATISNRIASLEEEIGARVFSRDAGDLRLTPVGIRRLVEMDLEPAGGTEAALESLMRTQAGKWKKVVLDADIKLD